MRRTLLSAFVLGASFAFPALAHDTLPVKWCPVGTQASISTTFSFTAEQLAAYREQQLAAGGEVLGSDCEPLKTCGIIDEWYWANQLAQDTCSGEALKRGTPPENAPMPFVSLPASFNLQTDDDRNKILDHHDLYRFKDGLHGQCVVCLPVTKQPSGTILRTR